MLFQFKDYKIEYINKNSRKGMTKKELGKLSCVNKEKMKHGLRNRKENDKRKQIMKLLNVLDMKKQCINLDVFD